MGAKRPSEPTPWCLFGFFLGIQKEARRPQGGEIPLRKPLGTARRVVAPYRRGSLPSGRPHGAAPTKNPNQGGFTEKKNPGAAGAHPRAASSRPNSRRFAAVGLEMRLRARSCTFGAIHLQPPPYRGCGEKKQAVNSLLKKRKSPADRGLFHPVEKVAALGLRYKCNKKEVTQIWRTPKMVFADNQEGGVAMSHYRHLSIEEREKLYLRRGQGATLREIARELGRTAELLAGGLF